MTSFQVKELKNFMTKLLTTDCFDSFLLAEASVSSQAEYTIDGHINRDFYTREELDDPQVCPYRFVRWSEIRPVCFQIIRGKRAPSRFKFVLYLAPDYVPGVLKGADPALSPEQVKALVLTIRYDGASAALVTGTSFSTFVLDKTLDAQWDKTMRRFLEKKGIACLEK